MSVNPIIVEYFDPIYGSAQSQTNILKTGKDVLCNKIDLSTNLKNLLPQKIVELNQWAQISDIQYL